MEYLIIDIFRLFQILMSCWMIVLLGLTTFKYAMVWLSKEKKRRSLSIALVAASVGGQIIVLVQLFTTISYLDSPMTIRFPPIFIANLMVSVSGYWLLFNSREEFIKETENGLMGE